MILQSGVHVFQSRNILFSGNKFVDSWQVHEIKVFKFFPLFLLQECCIDKTTEWVERISNWESPAVCGIQMASEMGAVKVFGGPQIGIPSKKHQRTLSWNRMLNETRSECRSVTKMYEHAMSSVVTLLLWIFIESCEINSVHHVPSSIHSVWLTKHFSTKGDLASCSMAAECGHVDVGNNGIDGFCRMRI